MFIWSVFRASKEGGGRPRRGRKSSKRKKSNSAVSSRRAESLTSLRLPSRKQSIPQIPELQSLPFPEAGLPPTASHPNSSGSVSPYPTPPNRESLLSNQTPGALHSKVKAVAAQIELLAQPERPGKSDKDKLPPSNPFDRPRPVQAEARDAADTDSRVFPLTKSSPHERDVDSSSRSISGGLQKPAALISKMKSMAIQGGQNIGIEPESIQRPMKKMKELLSSITAPQPSPPVYNTLTTTSSQPHTQTAYRNEDALPMPAQLRSAGPTSMTVPEPAGSAASTTELSSLQDSQVLEFSTATSDAM